MTYLDLIKSITNQNESYIGVRLSYGYQTKLIGILKSRFFERFDYIKNFLDSIPTPMLGYVLKSLEDLEDAEKPETSDLVDIMDPDGFVEVIMDLDHRTNIIHKKWIKKTDIREQFLVLVNPEVDTRNKQWIHIGTGIKFFGNSGDLITDYFNQYQEFDNVGLDRLDDLIQYLKGLAQMYTDELVIKIHRNGMSLGYWEYPGDYEFRNIGDYIRELKTKTMTLRYDEDPWDDSEDFTVFTIETKTENAK